MPNAWELQKELQDNRELPSQHEVFEISKVFKIHRNKVLFLMLYLCGCRVGELVRNPKKNWVGVRAKDIFLDSVGDKNFLVIRLQNEKVRRTPGRRRKWHKEIPIKLDGVEGEMAKEIIKYTQGMTGDDPVFDITPNRVWRILKKHTKFNPHWLRHLRLHHLTVNNNFSDQMLTAIAGWTDSRPAAGYTEIGWRHIAKKL
jgi:hypothetical protein